VKTRKPIQIESRNAIRVFPIEKKLNKDDSCQEVVADIIILKSSFSETRPNIPQVTEQHLIRASIATETTCASLEKLTGNEVHPVKSPDAQVF
jgi:hypothetical protein